VRSDAVHLVSNTYGPRDWRPTPHGKQLALAATGKLPFYVKDWTGEVVGIEDAATALLLAAEKGRNGERYIISDRFMGVGEQYETAAEASGVKSPRFGIPLWAMYAMGYAGDVARIALRRDTVLLSRSERLMHIWPTLDHRKAERELGWQPEPVHDSIRRAAQFYRANRRSRR
jgi:dihydroflavonol-4-reductase